MGCKINTGVLNKITELNLNPLFISLQALAYRFLRNKLSSLDSINGDIESVNEEISSVNDSILETNNGKLINIEELSSMNVNTDGCSVSDKNKRKENILKSLNNRKNELQDERNDLTEERTKIRTLYDSLLNGILGIIQRLITLLQTIVQAVGIAIAVIESAVLATSASIVGVPSSFSLKFVQDLLQSKLFEPCCDTVSQQIEYGTPSSGDFLPNV